MPTLATGKFALPYLVVTQAQKEVTHNEALARIDALLHPCVEDVLFSPPEPDGEADSGKCWLVANAATGAWTGKDGQLACWTGGGWRTLAPCEGMTLLNLANGGRLERRSDEWISGPVLSDPAGGTTIDAEARGAIISLFEYLRARGVLTP